MNITKKAVALLLVSAMTLPCFSCAHADSNSSSTAESKENSESSEGVLPVVDNDSMPEISGVEVNEEGVKVELEMNDIGQDEELPIVTTIRGQDGKIYVPQTDINGTTVTEEGGSVATVLYTGTTLASSYANPDYQALYKSYQSLWVDTSKKKDFVFDGDFLVFDIEIKADAPDGVYPIEFYHLDIANYDAKSLDVKSNVGYVCVGDAQIPTSQTTSDGFVLTPVSVKGKAGETVQVVIKAENNPGFCGFNLLFSYDANAMNVVSGGAGADFSSKAELTAHNVNE